MGVSRVRSNVSVGIAMATILALASVSSVARGSSGLPPTVTLQPEAPGPGRVVEVSGIDFPPGGQVDLLLITTERIIPLGTTQASEDGRIRTSVTMPEGLPLGIWEIRATGPDDAVAVRLFKATNAPAPAEPGPEGAGGQAAGDGAAAESATGAGGADLLVLLILLVLVVGVGGAAVAAWYIVKRGDHQPGLPTGDDPIYRGTGNPWVQTPPPMPPGSGPGAGGDAQAR